MGNGDTETTFNTYINLLADQTQRVRIDTSLTGIGTGEFIGSVVANGTTAIGNTASSF
jgi:hypothetical protein